MNTPSTPTWTARAPGRVNIIGEHIDYNDGWVLPMALEQGITITATPIEEPTALFESEHMDDSVRLDLRRPGRQATPSWGNYVQGVVWEFINDTGAKLPGFRATITSDLPQGGGLSSSAALEVATATLLEKITAKPLAPLDKVRLCQRVEHKYAGMPCGLMDQAASTLCRAGHLLLFDCVTNAYRHVPFPDGVSVLIANTGVTHALADSAYAQRREESSAALAALGKASFRDVTVGDLDQGAAALTPTQLRRARHVVTEMARTLDVVEALHQGDWETVGKHLYAGHDSLNMDYEVSCAELNELVAAARELGITGGVYGARMTGGGFGGCTVTLVREGAIDRAESYLGTRFHDVFGTYPTFTRARPADGAR